MKKALDSICDLLNRLTDEAETLVREPFMDDPEHVFVPPVGFSKLVTGTRTLSHMLGETHPWQPQLAADYPNSQRGYVRELLGAFRAIREALDNDWLTAITGLVGAEMFADLLEQGDHLLSEGYHLAAGVLGRAVLEEHLRSLCAKQGCSPAKERATLNDLNLALYKNRHLDKIAMKHVDAMAAIGNDAAHYNDSLQKTDVERLLRDVREFMLRNPM